MKAFLFLVFVTEISAGGPYSEPETIPLPVTEAPTTVSPPKKYPPQCPETADCSGLQKCPDRTQVIPPNDHCCCSYKFHLSRIKVDKLEKISFFCNIWLASNKKGDRNFSTLK